MHPDREIVSAERRSDGLSTRTDDLDTLTCKYSGTNNTPREPLHVPIKWNTPRHVLTYVYIYGYIYSPARRHNHHGQRTTHCCVNIPPIVASYPPLQAPQLESTVPHGSTVTNLFDSRFLMGLDSGFPDSILLKVFDWVWLSFLDSIWLTGFYGIWLMFLIFNLTHV